MSKLDGILLIAIGVGCSVIGDVFLKKWPTGSGVFLFVGVLLYGVGAVPVAYAFQQLEFGSVFIAFEAMAVVVAICLASIAFHEQITPSRIAAAVLALVAVYLSVR